MERRTNREWPIFFSIDLPLGKTCTMDQKNVLIEREGNLLIVTIARPDALNALNRRTMTELHALFVDNPVDESVQGVIITGAGTKAFIAGADIKEFVGMPAQDAAALSAYGQDIFNAIENYPVPVIAAINGFALGGGLELAMACHIRLASDNARFGQPEVNLGTIPGYGGTQRLIRLVGHGRAMHWLLTGDMIDAGTALQAGLVTGVYSQQDLLPEAQKLLAKIASKGPLAIKEIFNCARAYHDPEIDGFALESDRFGWLFETADFTEGVNAFLAKRPPSFTGK